MANEKNTNTVGLNRAKPYQLALFPLNNGATNVYFVLVLSNIATFGSNVLALGVIFASLMVTGMLSSMPSQTRSSVHLWTGRARVSENSGPSWSSEI